MDWLDRVLVCRSVRHRRLWGRLPALVFQRRPDDDVMTATRPGARRRNADEHQTGKGEPEAASRSSHSGAASRSLQLLRLVRVDTLIGSAIVWIRVKPPREKSN